MFAHTISRIRRNHGLEHATIHILSGKHKNFSAQGNSDHRGFRLNIYGSVSETDVTAAVWEAFQRMKAGEHHLAVHPNCGTALLTTATMTTLAAQGTFSLEQKRQKRTELGVPSWLNALPTAVLAAVVAMIVSRPFGLYLQRRFTTAGDLGDMEIVSIRKTSPSAITRLFQLLLTGGNPNQKATSYHIVTKG